MLAIFRGRRHIVVGCTANSVSLETVAAANRPASRIHVSPTDADLILDPTAVDLHMAEAFERGEISAFEYLDGHTYPPDREIVRPRRRRIIDSPRRHH